jgi:RimJ/RimL family protein N-acetyltransferase
MLPSKMGIRSSSTVESQVRPFRSSDIGEVVDIHLRTLETDFITSLGRRFLEKALYPTILHPASTGFGFVQVREGRVVGFIVGMLDISTWYRTLIRTQTLECVRAGIRRALSGWKGFRDSVQTIHYLLAGPSVGRWGKLFYLAIDGPYQGHGLSLKLVRSFLNYCREHGVSQCRTRASAENLAAHKLYTYVGFKEQRRLKMHGRIHIVYSMDLDE